MATAEKTRKRRKSDDEMERGEAPDTVEREEGGDADEHEDGAFDGQGVLIDVDDPDKKAILTIARRIRKRGVERGELQDLDEKDREKLKELFHEKKITVFRGGGFEINLKDLGEKVSVKSTAPAGDDE